MPAGQKGPVTILAKFAGIILLVFGLLWTAIGVVIVLGGAAAKVGGNSAGIPVVGNAVGDFLAGFGIVILVIAIIEVLGGVGVILSKDWGRIIGIIYALMFGVGSVFIVLGGVSASKNVDTGSGGAVTLIVGLVFLLGYLYSLFALGVRWRGRA
jgi:hypothetical protein